MNEYIRKNEDGESVLDFDLLDMAARINFQQHIERWADGMEVDLESEPDASEAEKNEAINDQAVMEVRNTLAYLYDDEGEEVETDPETKQWMIEVIISRLTARYMPTVA